MSPSKGKGSKKRKKKTFSPHHLKDLVLPVVQRKMGPWEKKNAKREGWEKMREEPFPCRPREWTAW